MQLTEIAYACRIHAHHSCVRRLYPYAAQPVSPVAPARGHPASSTFTQPPRHTRKPLRKYLHSLRQNPAP